MKDLMITNSELTMSSLEVAELTGKRHDHVLADIRKMLSELQSPEKLGDYKDSKGRTYPMLLLNKEEALCLVAGYNVKMRMAIIKRWQELENEPQFKIPTTLSEALQLAADQAKEIEVLAYERDEAIKTKAQIGSKREASAMAKASAEARKAKALEVKLDQSKEYASIKKMEIDYGGRYDWRLLKNASVEAELSIKKAQDVNYGEVNSYHKSVWKSVYNLEIK